MAFFTHRRNLNDPDILAQSAAEIGFDRSKALAVLEKGRYAQTVRDAERTWLERGIQGVPAMIFEERYLLSGAQGVENYAKVLKQLQATEAA